MEPMTEPAPAPSTQPDPTSVVGRRVAQFIVDYLITVLVVGGALSLFLLSDTDPEGGLEPNGLFWLVTAAYLAIALGWSLWVWVFRPVRAGGRTYGMQLLGIHVERLDGQALTAGTMAIRWVLLIVDSLVSGLVGLVTMLATERHQRVGDVVAQTIVVRD